MSDRTLAPQPAGAAGELDMGRLAAIVAQAMPEAARPADQPRLLLSVDEVAAALGVSGKTVRRMDLSGRLPRPVRLGRLLRWRADEIRAWIAAGAPPRNRWTWDR